MPELGFRLTLPSLRVERLSFSFVSFLGLSAALRTKCVKVSGFRVRGGVMVNSLTVFGPGLQVSLGRSPKEHSGLSVAHPRR